MAFERINNEENSLDGLRESVIVAMKEKPDDRTFLLEWMRLREDQAEKDGTSQASIQCAIDVAKLLMDVGLLNEAWDGLELTREAAVCENDDGKLTKEIERLMDKIESRT